MNEAFRVKLEVVLVCIKMIFHSYNRIQSFNTYFNSEIIT